MKELFTTLSYGFSEYCSHQHLLVLVPALLCYIGYRDVLKKPSRNERIEISRFLVWTLLWLILLWFPLSAGVLYKLQTSFYGYGFLWSFLPLTAAVGLGGCLLVQREGGKKPAVLICVLCLLIFVLGNMGRIRMPEQEAQETERAAKTLVQQLLTQGIAERMQEEGTLLWAPKEVLDAERKTDGSLPLLYGRDMWDVRAAAYAYDRYEEEAITLFDYMEHFRVYDAEWQQYDEWETFYFILFVKWGEGQELTPEDETLFQFVREKLEERGRQDAPMLFEAYKQRVNPVVVPEAVGLRMDFARQSLCAFFDMDAELLAQTEDYRVYWLKELPQKKETD